MIPDPVNFWVFPECSHGHREIIHDKMVDDVRRTMTASVIKDHNRAFIEPCRKYTQPKYVAAVIPYGVKFWVDV
jgi:hypothetical protein